MMSHQHQGEVIRRIADIQATSPMKIECARIYYTTHYAKAEKMLHRAYREKRKHGEWFSIGESDLAGIDAFMQRRFVCVGVSPSAT